MKQEWMIDVEELTVKYKNFTAVDKLSMQVAKGSAVALLGENGAGKTSTLRALASIIAPASSRGTVLGKPIGKLGQAEFARLGYVSENQKIPKQWTLQRLLEYLRPMYPTWDETFCQQLIADFELPLDRKLGAFSRGMQMKAMLVSSLSYHPELLIMDEPFSGLDPLVREELIDGVLELMQGGEWTVLLSSHDIYEVERLCDTVIFIEHGVKTVSESLTSLQDRFRRCSVLGTPSAALPDTWILQEQQRDDVWSFTITDATTTEATLDAIQSLFGADAEVEMESMSLRDIYLAMARDKKCKRRAALKATSPANK